MTEIELLQAIKSELTTIIIILTIINFGIWFKK